MEKRHTVFILEGEKDCENLVAHFKLTATTFPFGAGKWQEHYADYFQDAKVVIIPDNDKAGKESVQKIAHKLHGIAKSIRIIELPDLPHKGDITDWIEQGGTKEQLIELVKATPLWEPLSEDEEESYIERALKAEIAKLNEQYATVMLRGKYIIIEPYARDPSLGTTSIEFIATPALEKKFAHRKIVVGYRGDQPIEHNVISEWLQHPERRDYDGIVFDPGVDHGPRYYNLWQGFAIQPRKAQFDLYLQHIFEVIAASNIEVYNHLIALMADGVQLRPRPGVAVAIIGSQGVGKGVFIKNYGQLFGRHFLHITQASHLTGRFNRHLAEGMIVFVDEAFWAGDKQAEGVLKAMVTEETMMVEPKGCDAYPIKNHIRLFVASNNDWIVPAGLEERRFFVIQASDSHMQDTEYFVRLQKQMNNGGREGLLRYLQQYKLDDVDLTKFPRTNELANQKLLSLDPVQKFWFHVLEEGKLFALGGGMGKELRRVPWGDGAIQTQTLFDAFIAEQKNHPQKWFSGDAGFGIALGKLVPSRQKKKINGTLHYIFPSLQECRDQFDKLTQQKWDWPEISDDEPEELDDE